MLSCTFILFCNSYATVHLLRNAKCRQYTVSQKTVQTLFFVRTQNFVKFRPIVKIFGTDIAKRTSSSEVYLFSTSPNLCECTTV